MDIWRSCGVGEWIYGGIVCVGELTYGGNVVLVNGYM